MWKEARQALATVPELRAEVADVVEDIRETADRLSTALLIVTTVAFAALVVALEALRRSL